MYEKWEPSLAISIDQRDSQVKFSGIKWSCNASKVSGSKVGPDAASVGVCTGLRVIPTVEAVRAELHTATASFILDEALEQLDVPVISARTADVAEPEASDCEL